MIIMKNTNRYIDQNGNDFSKIERPEGFKRWSLSKYGNIFNEENIEWYGQEQLEKLYGKREEHDKRI